MKKRLLHRFYPCATAPSLLQQLVQFVINGLDLRADNDLTGVFPRTEDACCACRFYGLLIDLIVVLDHKAQAGSAVADRYYVVFAADAFQNVLCNLCVFACFGRVYFFSAALFFPEREKSKKATAHTTTTARIISKVVVFVESLLSPHDQRRLSASSSATRVQSGCIWRMEPGHSGVTGPVTTALTACALFKPLATTSTFRACMMVLMPMV